MNPRLRMVLAIAGLAATLSGLPAAAAVFSGDTTGGPVWERPLVSGDALTGIFVPYAALPLRVSASGTYSFTVTPQTGAFDIMQFLYDATFAPATPLQGYLAAEDIGINGEAEHFLFALTSNTTYFAVTTGYSEIDYDPYSLVITGPGSVTEVDPPPTFAAGDFNEDHSVNGSDLFSWRQGFPGAGPKSHMQGDADGDHDVDGDDLLIWQRQLNVGGGAAPAATSVPEPETLMTTLLGAACLVGWPTLRNQFRRRTDES